MLIGAAIGLVSSFIPELINIFKSRQEHKQEMQMLELQLKYQKEMTEMRIEEAKALSQIELDKQVYNYAPVTEFKPTGTTWIDALQIIGNLYNQTVRPTITYIVIASWILLKFAMWQKAGGTIDAVPKIWTEWESEFVSIVITFWFGSRSMLRSSGKIK